MPKEADGVPAFTVKSVLVGCAGAFSVSAGAAYGTLYLHGSFMALGTSMPGAVFILFLLTLFINPLLKLVHPRLGLNRRELLVVYAMMVMASPIPTLFVGKFLSAISYPFYYATAENEWRQLIHPYIPDWLMVHDVETVRKFYEGSGRDEAIPWEVWRSVIGVWTPFICALFLMMISFMAILRKQWIQHERLIYPLMQVPLAMTEEGEDDQKLSPFFKNPVMWAGFAIPALWGTLHGLYNYFPEIIPIAQNVDPIRMDVPVFRRTADLYVALRFNIIGFFYFLKTDIAFSLWFFNLLSFAVRGIFGILGVVSSETGGAGHAVHDPFLAYQSMGAILVLFLGGIWTARNHLRSVWRKAFKGDESIDDSDEILSYRAALIVLTVSCLVIVGWLWLAGLPPVFGLAILFLGVVIIFGYSRVVAEGGLSDGSPPVVPAGILVSAVGSSVIGSPRLSRAGDDLSVDHRAQFRHGLLRQQSATGRGVGAQPPAPLLDHHLGAGRGRGRCRVDGDAAQPQIRGDQPVDLERRQLQLCGEAPPHADRLLRLGLGQYGDWRGDYDRIDGRALALRLVAAAPAGLRNRADLDHGSLVVQYVHRLGSQGNRAQIRRRAALSEDAALFHGNDPRLFHPRRVLPDRRPFHRHDLERDILGLNS